MDVVKTLIRFRRHIMWIYILIVVILLTAPLPLQEGYQTEKKASIAHFLMFFILLGVVEFANLFSLTKETLIKAIIFGIVMESIQKFLPYRVFDFMDLMLNITGIIISYLTMKSFIFFFRRNH